MQVHFTPEQEAQLAHLAQDVGLNTEDLVKHAALRLIGSQLNSETRITHPSPLPVWHLGAVGSLRRCEIYNDDDI